MEKKTETVAEQIKRKEKRLKELNESIDAKEWVLKQIEVKGNDM